MRQVEQGDYSPYRVMIQGDRYWVVSPRGRMIYGWRTSRAAVSHAQLLYSINYT